MRKIISIFFATLIIFSVLHISVASHYCCGKLAAVKISLTGQEASCGMKTDNTNCPFHKSVSSNCCKNKISNFTVDHNYNPSFNHLQEVSENLFHAFYIPIKLQLNNPIALNRLFASKSPPYGRLQISSVDISNICVFRL